MMEKIVACAAAGLTGTAALRAGGAGSGFETVRIADLPELGGRMVRMRHVKTGADLVWLDRDDDNKTFAIAFKTIPCDDTGVAHIIEHSVLCGSGKYPVKEPFVDLLKSSFATFINAWTAADHTAYPVCSRNDADFRNLVDVYLDAVFDPLSVKSPEAFLQEGWHWEKDPKTGELAKNGVVYSEMKGAFADKLRLARIESDRMLFKDNAYRFVSAGDPKSIPDLDFAKYCDFYRRHYHPSNAMVFLDGKIDLKSMLERLDAEFSRFDAAAPLPVVPLQTPCASVKTMPYALPPGESPEDKTIILDSTVCWTFREIEKTMALKVVANALAETNEEPVTKTLIDKGLCEDVTIGVSDGPQVSVSILVENAASGKTGEIRDIVRSTISSVCDGGFDKEKLLSIIEREEFNTLEKDFGTFPRGLAFFLVLMDQWPYGGDLEECFNLRRKFDSLREKIAGGYFEKLAREVFLDNDAWARLEMVPDPGFAAREREKELAQTRREAENLGGDAKSGMELVKKFQEREDAPEDKAKLPRLSLSDVADASSVPVYRLQDAECGNGRICFVKTQAKGIAYATVMFPLDNFSGDELTDIAFGSDLFGELGTDGHSASALKKSIDLNLGRFTPTVNVYAEKPGGDAPGPSHVYLEIRCAALDGKVGRMLELAEEVMTRTSFRDPSRVVPNLVQTRRMLEMSASGMGAMRYARMRALASVSSAAAAEERVSGLSALRRLQKLDAEASRDAEGFCARLDGLMKRAVAAGAAYVFVSDNVLEKDAQRLAAMFPLGETRSSCAEKPFPPVREGFISHGDVSSIAKAGFIPGDPGPGIVASRILSLGHLWQEIRVKGGAYGGSFQRQLSGLYSYLSWNDPNPKRSLGVYADAPAALRAAADGDLTSFIISALAKLEPYMTPSGEMERVGNLVASGRTAQDIKEIEAGIMSVGKDDLLAFAGAMEKAAADAAVCIVGGEDGVESCRQALDRVECIASEEGD